MGKTMKRFLTRWPYFPILFVINTVMVFYFANYYEIEHEGLIPTLAIAILFVIIVWFLFFRIFNDLNKSALITFIFSALFFNFQNIAYSLRNIAISDNDITTVRFWVSNSGQRLVFCCITLLMVLVFILVKKLPKVNITIITYLNLFCVILLAIISFYGINYIIQNKKMVDNFSQYWQGQLNENTLPMDHYSNDSPDIYYIILDGFARSDTLLDLYDLDNSGFINELQSKRFYVATESYSNYTQTKTSLASSLNMMYLSEAAEVVGENTSNYYPAYYMVNNSIVEQSLRAMGYETVGFKSDATFTSFANWDIYYQPKSIPGGFIQTFARTTAGSVLINPLFYKWHRGVINYTVEQLPTVASREGPQFIFAHIMCPHPPFVFNSDGTPTKAKRLFTIQDANRFLIEGTKEEYIEGYRNQVVFIENEILKMVDQIMNTSTDPFILIIQADHGSGLQVDQDNHLDSNMTERLGILNAFYFYDQNYDRLYPEISPVNSFRVIFSQYLAINKPVLEDKHYSSNYTDTFNLVSVDDLLK